MNSFQFRSKIFRHDLFCHQSWKRIFSSLFLHSQAKSFSNSQAKFGIYNYFFGHCHLSLFGFIFVSLFLSHCFTFYSWSHTRSVLSVSIKTSINRSNFQSWASSRHFLAVSISPVTVYSIDLPHRCSQIQQLYCENMNNISITFSVDDNSPVMNKSVLRRIKNAETKENRDK